MKVYEMIREFLLKWFERSKIVQKLIISEAYFSHKIYKSGNWMKLGLNMMEPVYQGQSNQVDQSDLSGIKILLLIVKSVIL